MQLRGDVDGPRREHPADVAQRKLVAAALVGPVGDLLDGRRQLAHRLERSAHLAPEARVVAVEGGADLGEAPREHALEGGEVIITCQGFEPESWTGFEVSFDGVASRPESASAARIVAIVPAGPHGHVRLRVRQAEEASDAVDFYAAEKLADSLHPVANPAFDHDNGAIYTTLSGTRGQEVPFSVYKISPTGKSQPFLSDLMNPTGLAFDPDGTMFIIFSLAKTCLST